MLIENIYNMRENGTNAEIIHYPSSFTQSFHSRALLK